MGFFYSAMRVVFSASSPPRQGFFIRLVLGVFQASLFWDIWDLDTFPVRKGQGYGGSAQLNG